MTTEDREKYQEILNYYKENPNPIDIWRPEMYRCFLYMPRESYKIGRLMQVRQGGSPYGADAVIVIDRHDNTHAGDSMVYHIIDKSEYIEFLERIFPDDDCNEDTEFTISGKDPIIGFIV